MRRHILKLLLTRTIYYMLWEIHSQIIVDRTIYCIFREDTFSNHCWPELFTICSGVSSSNYIFKALLTRTFYYLFNRDVILKPHFQTTADQNYLLSVVRRHISKPLLTRTIYYLLWEDTFSNNCWPELFTICCEKTHSQTTADQN